MSGIYLVLQPYLVLGMCLVKNNTFKLGLEPFHGIILGHLMLYSDSRMATSSLSYTISWALQDNVEIHSINASGRIIFNTQVNMFVDAKSKISGVGEIAAEEFVLLDLEACLQELHCLLPTNSYMAGDLFITADRPPSDSVASLAKDWHLASELL